MLKKILLSSILFTSLLLITSCATNEKAREHQHIHVSGQADKEAVQVHTHAHERDTSPLPNKEMMFMQTNIQR